MPALFAYLLALCLLLGGGYGALNWLGEAEPVKVAAKANLKAKSSRQALTAAETNLTTTSLDAAAPGETSSPAQAGNAVVATIDSPAPHEAETFVEPPVGQGAQPKLKARSAYGEIPSDEAGRASQAAFGFSKPASFRAVATSIPPPPDSAARSLKQAQGRQAGSRPQQRKLELMTLRTIEFSDGRRVTRLIPHRARARALVFASEE